MKYRAIGLVELNSVAMGVHAADEMLKAANVELVLARPVCPGRYLALVTGDTGSVGSAVEVGRNTAGHSLVDWFIIPNIHHSVLNALHCLTPSIDLNALGIIETYSSSSCILAADAAAKAGSVELIELRLATGMAGKAFLSMTGNIDSVKASVDAGVAAVNDSGLILSHVVIPAPSQELKKHLL